MKFHIIKNKTKNYEDLIAVVKIKVPVSMWNVLDAAEEIKTDIFKEPEKWHLSDCSFNYFEFKPKENKR